MRLYIFKSERTSDLRAFAPEPDGRPLPPHHGPRTIVGVIGVDKTPPHNFSRAAIEAAIDEKGFSALALRQEGGCSDLIDIDSELRNR
jgi:hypothetical protein